MMDLTVEIEGDIGTLEAALKQFTHTETLDGENKYRCGRLDPVFPYFIILICFKVKVKLCFLLLLN